MHSHFIAILIVFAIHAILYTAGGIWLIANWKKQHDHSRPLLGMYAILMAVSCLIFIATAFWASADKQFEHSMLEPYPSILSFLIWTLLPLYIYEVRNPHRLTIVRFLVAYSPWIALCLGFIGWHASTGWATITPLTSFEAITQNIHSTEVILRIALAVIFVPYSLIVFIRKKSWREVSAPQPWITILAALTIIVTFTFVFGMLCRITSVMYLHVAIVDAIVLISLYMEAHIRIPVPETNNLDVHPAKDDSITRLA